MKLMDFLRARIFDRIGVSSKARILTCPGGHSWADSGLLCTTRDLALIGRFLLNGGTCDGEQLLDPEYIRAATAKQVDNNSLGIEDWNTYGYGYQIWRTYRNSWLFWGMGSQFMLCVPDKDLILAATGDNQGNPIDMRVLIKSFFNLVVSETEGQSIVPFSENSENGTRGQSTVPHSTVPFQELMAYADTLKLAAARGEKASPLEEQISGKIWHLEPNPMGITHLRLEFTEDGGTLFYTNEQGDKALPFGRCENRFYDFPEENYDDEIGTVPVPGHKYRCAASGAWTSPDKLFISVQVIDNYLGRLNINIGFTDGRIGLHMNKSAEAFLENYQGYAAST